MKYTLTTLVLALLFATPVFADERTSTDMENISALIPITTSVQTFLAKTFNPTLGTSTGSTTPLFCNNETGVCSATSTPPATVIDLKKASQVESCFVRVGSLPLGFRRHQLRLGIDLYAKCWALNE